MFSFRFVPRRRSAEPVPAQVALPGLGGVHDSPLVPCNNLRARWVAGADGKLELRWELPQGTNQAQAA